MARRTGALMLFSELRFIVFFTIVFGVYWALRGNRPRKHWLLAASYFFYGSWDWRFLSLIVVSTLVDYLAAARIHGTDDEAQRRRWLTVSILLNLGLLGFFKYFNFFIQSGTGLLDWFGVTSPVRELSIVLPIGISFFTFQSMSYTIDVYRGKLAPTRHFADFALFVSFFPQLVAGPIVRAAGFLPQLDRARRFADVNVQASLLIFLTGFVKKACVADHLALPVDAVFAADAAYGATSHWLALLLYHAQLYCDFSGYTDMAIGTAGLLGYALVPNFDFPYFAKSLREFWRRWHISLSSWFRDYLFIPLGGSRRSFAITLRNLMLVYVLCGLWHGAAWTFVGFGFFQGGFLLLERTRFDRWREAAPAFLQWLYVLVVLLLSWAIFRSQDATQVAGFFGALAGFGDGSEQLPLLFWTSILAGLFAVHASNRRLRWVDRIAGFRAPAFALLYGFLVGVALQWVATGHRPFIYFQF